MPSGQQQTIIEAARLADTGRGRRRLEAWLFVCGLLRRARVGIVRRIEPSDAAIHERGRVAGYRAGHKDARREAAQLRLVVSNAEPLEVYRGRHATG
jgi:hypothetical protein